MKVEVVFKNGYRVKVDVDPEVTLLRFVAQHERAHQDRVKQIKVLDGKRDARPADPH